MPHVIEAFSNKLSTFNRSVVKPKLQAYMGVCDCCGRQVDEAVRGNDGYRKSRNVCADCATLFYSDTSVFGWSKEPKSTGGKGQANTFNMMPMTSAIIPLGEQKAVLYPPPAKHAKIPSKILEFIDMELIQSKTARLIHAVNHVKPPFIYIDDIGRKSFDLIKGLRVTESLSRLYICDDSKVTLIDYQASMGIAQLLVGEKPSKRGDFINLVRRRALGDMTPVEAAEIIKNDELFMACSNLLPADPHMRLDMIPVINEIIKELEALN